MPKKTVKKSIEEPPVKSQVKAGKARWKGISRVDRVTAMSEMGKLGGRPLHKDRCYCGANTRNRATARAFDCCKKAGKYPAK